MSATGFASIGLTGGMTGSFTAPVCPVAPRPGIPRQPPVAAS